MAENTNSDLQSILATLAQYAPDPATSTEQHAGSLTPLFPDDASRSDMILRDSPAADHARPQTQDPRLRPQSRSVAASPKPMIDPATITSWQEGLRCITKIAASDSQFAVSIKRMMKDQRTNEMRWYTERQNLKQTQANRSSSAAKAQSILKSLNTSLYCESPAAQDVGIDQEKELAEFDRKIYSAQLSMEAAMTAELKGLGVPFFGTAEKLVVPEGSDLLEQAPPEGQPKWSPIVTRDQLLELRRKMVGHLEDLYRD